MTREALHRLQGGRRDGASAGVLYFAGFRYWTASVLPAIVGTTLPFWLRPPGFSFRWLGAVEFLIATVLMHAGFSFLQARFERGATGKWSESRLLVAASGCIVLACLLGLHLSRFTSGGIFIVYGVATLFAGLLYVAPPVRFSQHAGGEIVVAMSMSLIPVLGAYLVQTGDLTRTVYLAALPIYAATGLWVWTEQMVSRSSDEEAGRETLVTVLGPRISGRIAVPVISASLCAALLLAVLSASTTPWALTALLSLGLLWRIVSVSWSDYADAAQMFKVRTRAFIVHLVVCVIIAVSSLASCGEVPTLETEQSGDSVFVSWEASMVPPAPGDSGTPRPYIAFDSPPKVLRRAELAISDSLLLVLRDSTVLVQVRVDAAGHPTEVEGLRGDSLLIPYACEAVEQWLFAPATCQGIPIPLDIVVRVEFGRSPRD